MRARLLIIFLQSVLASQLWAQSPEPKADQVYVVSVGDVHPQGLISYTPGMKLMAAIAAAGDIDFADRISVVLIRCGKKETIKIKHLRGSPSEPVLQPWDIIYFRQVFLVQRVFPRPRRGLQQL